MEPFAGPRGEGTADRADRGGVANNPWIVMTTATRKQQPSPSLPVGWLLTLTRVRLLTPPLLLSFSFLAV